MATTAFAAPETHTDTPVSATQSETALVIVSKAGDGQIAISDDGSEPVFDDFPSQNVTLQTAVGNTVIVSAKADEGWNFAYWMNADTQEFISMDATVSVEVTGAMNLKAVFMDASLVTVNASTEGNGQVAISQDGSEPVFDDDFPSQNPSVQAAVGDTIILSAKADEGAGSLHTGSIWIQRSLSPWMPLSRWK